MLIEMEEDDHHNVPPVTVNVKFNEQTIQLRMSLLSTVHQLKVHLHSSTYIPPVYQQLIYQGRIVNDGHTLMESGFIHGDNNLTLLETRNLQLKQETPRKKSTMEGDDPDYQVPVTLNIEFKRQTIKLYIFLSSHVLDVKLLLRSSTNIPPLYQQLIFKGNILKDGYTLMDYGMTHRPNKLMLLETQNLQTELERWNEYGIIYLHGGHLTAFPHEVWTHASDARVLDISYNKLEEVPKKLGSLTTLQKVNLSGNYIRTHLISWESFNSLSVLSLKQNLLTSLSPAIGLLGKLVQLDISCNRLNRVPDEIGQLTRLEILKASNNRINYIPPSIMTCTSLVEVDLSFNLLTELPTTFMELVELQALYLSSNEQLQTLPSTLFKNCLELSTLDVNGTEITDDLLSQFQGWEEFAESRVLKSPTPLDFSVPRIL